MNDQIKKILVINAGSSSLKWALYADKDLGTNRHWYMRTYCFRWQFNS
nr:hypothetical protein [Mycoplasmopsis bovis]